MGLLPPHRSAQRFQGLSSFDWGWEAAAKAKCAAVSIPYNLVIKGARAIVMTPIPQPLLPSFVLGNTAALMALDLKCQSGSYSS